jgi:hypothetical protein
VLVFTGPRNRTPNSFSRASMVFQSYKPGVPNPRNLPTLFRSAVCLCEPALFKATKGAWRRGPVLLMALLARHPRLPFLHLHVHYHSACPVAHCFQLAAQILRFARHVGQVGRATSTSFPAPCEHGLVDHRRPPPLKISLPGLIVPPHYEPRRMPGTGVVLAASWPFLQTPQDVGEPPLVQVPPEIGGGASCPPAP